MFFKAKYYSINQIIVDYKSPIYAVLLIEKQVIPMTLTRQGPHSQSSQKEIPKFLQDF